MGKSVHACQDMYTPAFFKCALDCSATFLFLCPVLDHTSFLSSVNVGQITDQICIKNTSDTDSNTFLILYLYGHILNSHHYSQPSVW